MEENMYVTITGFSYHFGKLPFSIGNILLCEKDPSNRYDSEAITVRLPIIGTIGSIANSTKTVAGGTMSAGRIYDKVGDKFYIRVMFTTQSKIICKVEEGDEDVFEKEIQSQLLTRNA